MKLVRFPPKAIEHLVRDKVNHNVMSVLQFLLHRHILPPSLNPSRARFPSVSRNPIVGWAPNISRLRKMKLLRLSAVGLGQCPEGLAQLGKLEDLDLSENSIDTLDPSMASLFKLRKLNLRKNAIKVRFFS